MNWGKGLSTQDVLTSVLFGGPQRCGGRIREGGVAVASATGVVRKPVIVATEVETVGSAAGGKVTGTGGTSEDTRAD